MLGGGEGGGKVLDYKYVCNKPESKFLLDGTLTILEYLGSCSPASMTVNPNITTKMGES